MVYQQHPIYNASDKISLQYTGADGDLSALVKRLLPTVKSESVLRIYMVPGRRLPWDRPEDPNKDKPREEPDDTVPPPGELPDDVPEPWKIPPTPTPPGPPISP